MSRDRRKEREKDLTLWAAWKADPIPDKLEPLLDNLQKVIIPKVNEFKAAAVPPAAVHGMANAAVVKALNSYDPNKGANLATHVTWHLKKVRSFVVKHQNLGRIPEHRAYRITDYKNARDEMTHRNGTLPDAVSLAERLGWSTAEVGRMERELRSDLIASKNLEPDRLAEMESNRDREVLRYIHYHLNPDERLVFEYSLGLYGKPLLPAGRIAKTMGISMPKVSRIRKKIDMKLRERGV